MIVTATEFKTSLGKYLKMALLDDLVGILNIIQVVDAVAERTRFPLSPYSRFPSSKILRIFSVSSSVAASRGWAQLRLYESEWRRYADRVTGLFEGRMDFTASDENKQEERNRR